VLSTAQKDDFLARLESSVVRGSGLAPFALAPVGVEWHRTEESARSFLVLRVASVTLTSRERQEKNRNEEGKAAAAAAAAAAKEKVKAEAQNPHLTTLLRRSNALVTSFGQPALYAFARRPPSNPSRSKDESPSADRNADAEAHTNTEIDKAFHISIAWTFAPPDSELRRLTEKAFHGSIAPAPTTTTPDHLLLNAITPCGTNISSNGKPSHDGGSIRIDSTGLTTIKEAIGAMRVLVDGVKAKIGNVVTHVSLPDVRSRKNREEGRGLFGI
jgi:hypothetical protein